MEPLNPQRQGNTVPGAVMPQPWVAWLYLALAAAGAAVAVNTLNSREDAEAVVNEIRAAGGTADVFLADISDAAAVRAMGEAVIKRFGKIDILVLNASQRREILFKDMTFEDWRNTMSITLDGSFHCIKACLPSMLEHKHGNIITLGGDAVLLGGKSADAAYWMDKGRMVSSTAYLQRLPAWVEAFNAGREFTIHGLAVTRAELWEAGRGLAVSDRDRRLAIGNPNEPVGAFYEACREVTG